MWISLLSIQEPFEILTFKWKFCMTVRFHSFFLILKVNKTAPEEQYVFTYLEN